MNIAAVMDEVGVKLGTISGLRVFPFSVKSVQPPAAIVGWPDPYNYDLTFGRGSDRFTLPIYVVVGNVDAKASRNKISAYANGSGTSSIKAVLEAAVYTECDTVVVRSCEFSSITVAGVEFLAATFQVDVTGAGS